MGKCLMLENSWEVSSTVEMMFEVICKFKYNPFENIYVVKQYRIPIQSFQKQGGNWLSTQIVEDC